MKLKHCRHGSTRMMFILARSKKSSAYVSWSWNGLWLGEERKEMWKKRRSLLAALFFSFWSFNTPHSPHFHPNWWWTRNKKEFNIFVNFFHFTGANSEKHRQKFHLVCEVEKSYINPRRRWSAWKRYFSPGLFLFTKWKSSSHEFQFAGVFWFFSSVFFCCCRCVRLILMSNHGGFGMKFGIQNLSLQSLLLFFFFLVFQLNFYSCSFAGLWVITCWYSPVHTSRVYQINVWWLRFKLFGKRNEWKRRRKTSRRRRVLLRHGPKKRRLICRRRHDIPADCL